MSTKRKRKVAIFSVIAVVIIVALGAMKAKAGKKEEPKLPVKVGKAEVADIQVKVTEVGTVQPEVKVDVKSAVSGKVTEILHRDGDSVKRGDILARVEPDLNQAQSLAETKNDLSAAQIRYEQAKKNFDADHSLFLQGLLATKQNRDSETEYLAAKQELDKAHEKYGLVEKSGIPINQSPSSFQGSILFTVADVSSMIVKAGVNEVDIGKIHVDMPVKVTLDAYPKVAFAGRIARIAPAVRIDDKVRVFDVEIRLDAQGRELRSGMTANIEVVGERKDKALTGPIESVFQRDGAEIVFVKKPWDPKAQPAAAAKKEDVKKEDAWKQFFEKRTVVSGLADNTIS